MTEAKPAIDPLLAAALDRFSVPSPSSGFEDRIFAAAIAGRGRAQPRWSSRGARRPWTRRVVVGAAAVALCTTALAAALFDHAGWRLQSLPVLIASVAAPTKHVAAPPRQSKQVARQAALSPDAPEIAVSFPDEAAQPSPVPETRREIIKQRLATMPPEIRQKVIQKFASRLAIAHPIAAKRLAERAQLREGAPADRPLGRRLADHPRLREKLVERLKERRDPIPDGTSLAPRPASDARVFGHPRIGERAASITTVETGSAIDGAPEQTSVAGQGGRAERLRELRQMRALRNQLRRQRRP